MFTELSSRVSAVCMFGACACVVIPSCVGSAYCMYYCGIYYQEGRVREGGGRECESEREREREGECESESERGGGRE